jgi:membrane protease subunit HflC
MSKNHSFLAFVLVSVFILLSQSTFVLQEGEQALVLQFGETKGSYTEPGLKFKTPFIQQVKLFEKRVLDVDPPPEEIILADQKRMVVDTFARYRITDMLEFYKSLATEAAGHVAPQQHYQLDDAQRSGQGIDDRYPV